MVNSITVISLNVAGLNNPIKRRWIAKLILTEQSDIVCLQETHLRVSEKQYLREIYKDKLYHATAATKTRGALLGLSTRLPWIYDKVDLDPNQIYNIAWLPLGRWSSWGFIAQTQSNQIFAWAWVKKYITMENRILLFLVILMPLEIGRWTGLNLHQL